MILRSFLALGLILLGGTAWFTVVVQPPAVQQVPLAGETARLQEEGILPVGPLEENEEVEHSIFEVPPEDEEMLEAAMANMDMGGMDMSGMDMSDDGTMQMGDGSMQMDGDGGMDMDMDGDGVMDMNSADMPSDGTMQMGDGSMQMDGDGGMDMASAEGDEEHGEDEADEAEEEHGEDEAEAEHGEEEEEGHGGGAASGLMISADGAFDREVELTMSEWTFSDLEIEMKAGERVRFTVKNAGMAPHEFMFMTMAQMQAVNYRSLRADWSLLEHEALFEKSLLMPGEDMSFIIEVQRAGSWMFMCMLPYHMQMGMMGQIATPGAAMDM